MKSKTTSFNSKLKQYGLGFAWSILLTLAAYGTVVNELLPRTETIVFILAVAIIQLWVQLYFFLHIGEESGPKWSLWTFLFMSLIMLFIVVGSLWIMHNLNYNMMPMHEMDEYMIKESNKGF